MTSRRLRRGATLAPIQRYVPPVVGSSSGGTHFQQSVVGRVMRQFVPDACHVHVGLVMPVLHSLRAEPAQLVARPTNGSMNGVPGAALQLYSRDPTCMNSQPRPSFRHTQSK